MEPLKIVAIVTVKNEDLYIGQVLRNILHFCDHIIIAENYSQDRTYEIAVEFAARHTHIELHRIRKFHEGHQFIEPFAGTPTWIFGVDGDEIYDPFGLEIMRTRILAGEFLDQRCIYGNVLNCVSIDRVRHVAQGYLSPPARSMTKLYNFSVVRQWTNGTERLHGGTLIFQDGFDAQRSLLMNQIYSWEHSPFRCLHTVFLPRSSMTSVRFFGRRFNPNELMQQRQENIGKHRWGKLFTTLKWHGRLLFRRDWKSQKYRRGPLMEKQVAQFFPAISEIME